MYLIDLVYADTAMKPILVKGKDCHMLMYATLEADGKYKVSGLIVERINIQF